MRYYTLLLSLFLLRAQPRSTQTLWCYFWAGLDWVKMVWGDGTKDACIQWGFSHRNNNVGTDNFLLFEKDHRFLSLASRSRSIKKHWVVLSSAHISWSTKDERCPSKSETGKRKTESVRPEKKKHGQSISKHAFGYKYEPTIKQKRNGGDRWGWVQHMCFGKSWHLFWIRSKSTRPIPSKRTRPNPNSHLGILPFRSGLIFWSEAIIL